MIDKGFEFSDLSGEKYKVVDARMHGGSSRLVRQLLCIRLRDSRQMWVSEKAVQEAVTTLTEVMHERYH